MDSINPDVCSVIDNILENTQNLVSNYGTKFTTYTIIENFIKNTKDLINKIVNYFSKDSNVLEDITTKWDLCVNRIVSYIKYDLKDGLNNIQLIILNKLKGITFLIPGSCYPPYFYFYYCDICE